MLLAKQSGVASNDAEMAEASDGSADQFDSSDESEISDDALNELFHQKKLKPGLNVIEKKTVQPANDSERLKIALEKIILRAPWLERMDLVSGLASISPELAAQIEKHQQKRENQFKGNRKIPYVAPENDPVLNDFNLEILLHRQAQAATIEGIRRLHELGVVTKRPDDYFAEMAKSDEHMRRITKVLQDKQKGMARSERMRQLREQRRIGKLIQRQATERGEEERRKMLNDVKKFRKGKLANLDFLHDDDEGPRGEFRKSGKSKPSKKQANGRRQTRRQVRSGSKRNTGGSCKGEGSRKRRAQGGKGGAAKKRPGKSRRAQGKSGRK